jgi:capsular polysaccharide transport system ATP-binding protein
MIIVSHDPGYIRAHCSRAAVLIGGELHHLPSVDEAFEFYHEQSLAA